MTGLLESMDCEFTEKRKPLEELLAVQVAAGPQAQGFFDPQGWHAGSWPTRFAECTNITGALDAEEALRLLCFSVDRAPL